MILFVMCGLLLSGCAPAVAPLESSSPNETLLVTAPLPTAVQSDPTETAVEETAIPETAPPETAAPVLPTVTTDQLLQPLPGVTWGCTPEELAAALGLSDSLIQTQIYDTAPASTKILTLEEPGDWTVYGGPPYSCSSASI